MYLLIDNYDSFTFNLWHYLSEIGADVIVKRNDKISVEEVMMMKPQGIILSPGPCNPDKAGICLSLVNMAINSKTPLFGVCLGHQSIAQALGAKIIRLETPMHGKTSSILHNGHGMFSDVPRNFVATRYHSLTIECSNLPDVLEITARTEDNIIMAISHKSHKITGVQFHPESIASEFGHQILKNFLQSTGLKTKNIITPTVSINSIGQR